MFVEASRLNPADASIHANLGRTYALIRDRGRAVTELREAARLDPGSPVAEQMICQTYDVLGETPLAVEHYERFLTLARKQGINLEIVRSFEQRERELKATLRPSFISAGMPKIYTDPSLQIALRRKLTPTELAMVVNPIASSPEMKRWASQLIRGATTDLDKARRLYEALERGYYSAGGARTARQVFASWNHPGASFSCQELAKLFVALARDVGVPAFYALVERDFQGKPVYHACAALFVDGRALLVDPAYRWFGVPHKEVVPLNDLQAIALQLLQTADAHMNVARCRVAVKLYPGSVYGQVVLSAALIEAGRWEEVRPVLAGAVRRQPARWDVDMLQGLLAWHDRHDQAALDYLQKAVAANPEGAEPHVVLARILRVQGKLNAAREQYRAGLHCEPAPPMAEEARRSIAEINEKIGATANDSADRVQAGNGAG